MNKTYLLSAIALAALLFASCGEDCENLNNPSCEDAVPTDELCEAYFERWFYDTETQSCVEIGYSGCNEYGFATQAECEECPDCY